MVRSPDARERHGVMYPPSDAWDMGQGLGTSKHVRPSDLHQMLRLTANSKKSFKDPFQYSVSPKVWAVFRIRLMCGRHNQTHQSMSMESSKIYVLSILQLFDRTNCVSSPRKTVALSDCRLQPRGDLVSGFSSSIPHWHYFMILLFTRDSSCLWDFVFERQY